MGGKSLKIAVPIEWPAKLRENDRTASLRFAMPKRAKEKPSEKRRRLFKLYSANAAIFAPEYSQYCPCPICLSGFGERAIEADTLLMDIAHVFPKSCGGNGGPKVLTCKQCNSRIGREYDSEFAYDSKLVAALDGSGNGCVATRIRLPGGTSIGTEFRKQNGGFRFDLIPKQTNPVERDRLIKSLRETGDLSFTMDLRTPDPKRYPVSLLHSAYLAMYRYFGFEYLVTGNSEWIRDILVREDAPDDVPFFTLDVPKGCISVARNDLLYTPFLATSESGLHALAVAFPAANKEMETRIVLLPGFGKEAMHDYEKLRMGWENSQQRIGAIFEFHPLEPRLVDPKCQWFGNNLWRRLVAQSREPSSKARGIRMEPSA